MPNSKPKVLFIMHMPPPVHGAAQMGQYIHDSKLITESFECRYFNPSASSNVKQVGHLSIRKIFFLFSSIFRIAKIVDEWNPDLVYITPSSWDWGFYRDFLTVQMLKRKKCKVVAHFHNRGVEYFRKKWFNKRLYGRFFKGIKTIFLSEKLAPEFSDFLNDNQIFICPNGIPMLPLRKKIRGSSDVYTFFFLSNMMAEKGVYVLLEACKILKEKSYNFKCDFVGKWADVQQSDFEEKKLLWNLDENVFAYGAKYGQEKVQYFENSNCFVFPTHYHGEAFPLVVLEALNYSLPVISTNVAGIPDIVENKKNGFCVEPQNAEKLAEAMAWMIDHPEEGERMGRNGREIFEERFTIEKFESNIYKILRECLECPTF